MGVNSCKNCACIRGEENKNEIKTYQTNDDLLVDDEVIEYEFQDGDFKENMTKAGLEKKKAVNKIVLVKFIQQRFRNFIFRKKIKKHLDELNKRVNNFHKNFKIVDKIDYHHERWDKLFQYSTVRPYEIMKTIDDFYEKLFSKYPEEIELININTDDFDYKENDTHDAFEKKFQLIILKQISSNFNLGPHDLYISKLNVVNEDIIEKIDNIMQQISKTINFSSRENINIQITENNAEHEQGTNLLNFNDHEKNDEEIILSKVAEQNLNKRVSITSHVPKTTPYNKGQRDKLTSLFLVEFAVDEKSKNVDSNLLTSIKDALVNNTPNYNNLLDKIKEFIPDKATYDNIKSNISNISDSLKFNSNPEQGLLEKLKTYIPDSNTYQNVKNVVVSMQNSLGINSVVNDIKGFITDNKTFEKFKNSLNFNAFSGQAEQDKIIEEKPNLGLFENLKATLGFSSNNQKQEKIKTNEKLETDDVIDYEDYQDLNNDFNINSKSSRKNLVEIPKVLDENIPANSKGGFFSDLTTSIGFGEGGIFNKIKKNINIFGNNKSEILKQEEENKIKEAFNKQKFIYTYKFILNDIKRSEINDFLEEMIVLSEKSSLFYKGTIHKALQEKYGYGTEYMMNKANGKMFKYKGTFMKNVHHGYGLLQKEGDYAYYGEFRNGEITGFGIENTEDGYYSGMFSKGKFCGYGEYQPSNKKYIYKGCFYNGQKHGIGELLYQDKSKYVGFFYNNKMNGNGYFKWNQGHSYYGFWKDDQMHGKGKYIWESGDTFIGNYENDKKHGEGIYIFKSNGAHLKGTWKNGKKDGRFILSEKNKLFKIKFKKDHQLDCIRIS